MQLSICMMVKNESKYLERCLTSLQPLRDSLCTELIIVDTGSEDNTVSIAKRFTDKVFFHNWTNNFAEMRNITLQYAIGRWVLIIDGDEILESPQGLIQFIQSPDSDHYGAAAIYVKNFTNGEDWSKFSLITSPRLFSRTPEFRYEGAVHNQPVVSGDITFVPSMILHYGYLSNDKELMERKFARTSAILKDELLKNPSNVYYWYQLAVTYAMHKDFHLALEAIIKCYDIAKEQNLNFKNSMFIYTTMALMYQNARDLKNVIRVCTEGLHLGRDYIDLCFLLAEAYLHQGNTKEALHYYLRYIHQVENYDSQTKDPAVVDYTLGEKDYVYYQLCALWREEGDLDKALSVGLKIARPDVLPQAFTRLIALCVEMNKYEVLLAYYENFVIAKYSQLKNTFEEAVEFNRQYWSQEEYLQLAITFAKGHSEYSMYFSAWLENRYPDRKYLDNILDIESVSLKGKPDRYGELVYWAISQDDSALTTILSTCNENDWNKFFNYLRREYSNIGRELTEYVGRVNKVEGPVYQNYVLRTLCRYCILMGMGQNNEALRIRYITEGIRTVTGMYSPDILSTADKNYLSILNAEDLFFISMYQAYHCWKKKDHQKFNIIMQDIIKNYPGMKQHLQFEQVIASFRQLKVKSVRGMDKVLKSS